VCDGVSKFLSEKNDRKVTVWRENDPKSRFTTEMQTSP
jgi:hypothetical protein